ncbi:D-alanyl-D-alanine carboxypeptidase family protein [Bacillus sp. FJAT-44742]|uniref:D-alanyl-D-alanine carboxypeptidase family protein n=1 Tax=Bacillus sp. FJAT-44742 TaxID=2014005 RepID=UPI000C23A588|nr:D-alanyl-D-alanine carboxypeptidase family protein [Bacillus sp. FJAT-44742]
MRGLLKRSASIFLACLLVLSVSQHAFAEEKQAELAEEAAAAILMEADTGRVLYEKNSEESLPPASMTKIMTMLLIMEAIDEGKIDYEDKVVTSEYAASMGGSQIFLEPGEEMTVRDMLKGIAVASGNDASVAMAEHIGGSEEKFVEMMNKRAEELGLENTHFTNTNGLPVENHYTSAKDLALMARELLKHEKITSFTGIYEDYLRQGTDDEFWLVNTNRLVKFYPGVDGLKTGFTQEAKYGLVATAKKQNMRVISVIMGATTPKTRNSQTTSLLDYAFNHYDIQPLYDKDHVIDRAAVEKGDASHVTGVLGSRISLLIQKGLKLEDISEKVEMNKNLKAPIKKGETIGKFVVEKDGEILAETDIVAREDIKEATWWGLFKRTLAKMSGIDAGSNEKESE